MLRFNSLPCLFHWWRAGTISVQNFGFILEEKLMSDTGKGDDNFSFKKRATFATHHTCKRWQWLSWTQRPCFECQHCKHHVCKLLASRCHLGRQFYSLSQEPAAQPTPAPLCTVVWPQHSDPQSMEEHSSQLSDATLLAVVSPDTPAETCHNTFTIELLCKFTSVSALNSQRGIINHGTQDSTPNGFYLLHFFNRSWYNHDSVEMCWLKLN